MQREWAYVEGTRIPRIAFKKCSRKLGTAILAALAEQSKGIFMSLSGKAHYGHLPNIKCAAVQTRVLILIQVYFFYLHPLNVSCKLHVTRI